MPAYLTETDQPVSLGAELARGGEGVIYAVAGQGAWAAKVYHPAHRSADKERKLRAMLAAPPQDDTRRLTPPHISIAWPEHLLYEQPQCVGFLMPRLPAGLPTLFQVYNPQARARALPQFDQRYLCRAARNLAVSLHALHAAGYVMGDVNQKNVLVAPDALISLVDTDSFQVPSAGGVFRCPVGVAEFTPPELQGVLLADVDRLPSHDNFGLAVLVFQLLMEGHHPFMGVPADPTLSLLGPAHLHCLKSGIFPYIANAEFAPPPSAPPFENLAPGLQTLFLRCFVDGHRSPDNRPVALAWVQALAEAEQTLKPCSRNPAHWYFQHLSACPWCGSAAVEAGPVQQRLTSLPLPEPARPPESPPPLEPPPPPLPDLTRTPPAARPVAPLWNRPLFLLGLLGLLALVVLAGLLGGLPRVPQPTADWAALTAVQATRAAIPQATSKVMSVAAASLPLQLLPADVVDARYSSATGQLVFVSSRPANQLHIYDPVGRRDLTVNLPRAPRALALSQDGNYAAVGHDASITYVDLQNLQVLKTFPVATLVDGLELAPQTVYFYSWDKEGIAALDLATGQTAALSGVMTNRSRYVFHPSGKVLYGVNEGYSPESLFRLDVSGAAPRPYGESPSWGDYSYCGNLWLSADEKLILTACGNLFRAAPGQKDDMTYAGRLSGSLYHWLAGTSEQIVALPATWDYANARKVLTNQLQIFDAHSLALVKTVPLPDFASGGKAYPSGGAFVFVDERRQVYYALVQAAGSPDPLFGLVADALPPVAAPQPTFTPLVTDTPTATPTPAAWADTSVTLPFTYTNESLVAGGGSYVILRSASPAALSVYAVDRKAIVHTFQLADSDFLFAAGGDTLLVYYPKENLFQTWSLTTYQLVKAKVNPKGVAVANLTMGHNNGNRALVRYSDGTDAFAQVDDYLLDVNTLQEIPLAGGRPANVEFRYYHDPVRRQADGNLRLVSEWSTDLSPSGVGVYQVADTSWTIVYHHASEGYLAVGDDGFVYTGYGFIHNRQLDQIGFLSQQHLIPGLGGALFLGIPESGTLTIYASGATVPLGSLGSFPNAERLSSSWTYADVLHDFVRWLVFDPPQRCLIVLSPGTNRLVQRDFDLARVLAASGGDYLVVTSSPNTVVTPGATWQYTLTVASNTGGLTYDLQQAPPGMQLTKAGVLTWPVPPKQTGAEKVIIQVSNEKGLTRFHTFELIVP